MTTIANHPHHDMGYLLKPGHSLICRADRMPSPTSRRRGNHADPEPQAMLARLSIRDIVLIDRLDLDFASGLSVLTGETGAGKSILLDAFALALGARGDATLVRQGAEQGQVTAMFELPPKHPARTLLADSDIAADEALILRRVQFADGRTRAFVNDQPVSVQALQALGCMLVEIHGQHDARALVDAGTHRGLLDAYARLEDDADQVDTLWTARRQAADAVTQHRADVERAHPAVALAADRAGADDRGGGDEAVLDGDDLVRAVRVQPGEKPQTLPVWVIEAGEAVGAAVRVDTPINKPAAAGETE